MVDRYSFLVSIDGTTASAENVLKLTLLLSLLDYVEGALSDSVASLVSELSDDVVLLSQRYAAWCLLMHPEERAPYAAVIERYGAFLEPTAVAHFQLVAVTTCQLRTYVQT